LTLAPSTVQLLIPIETQLFLHKGLHHMMNKKSVFMASSIALLLASPMRANFSLWVLIFGDQPSRPVNRTPRPTAPSAAEARPKVDINRILYDAFGNVISFDVRSQCTRMIEATLLNEVGTLIQDDYNTDRMALILHKGVAQCGRDYAYPTAFYALGDDQAAQEVARSMEENILADRRMGRINIIRWVTEELDMAIIRKRHDLYNSHRAEAAAADPVQPAR